ncbi:hypothetical protein VCHC78A1_00276B, partial [Vibrio cholerae HC-78A1]
PPPGLPLEG